MTSVSPRGHRRCFECGEKLRLQKGTVEYPESGLDNVRLVDVPIWRCSNGHDEVEIPGVDELHSLLAETVIRKRAPLVGSEVRFLRKRLEMTAQQFATRLAMTPVHLSRIENGRSKLMPQIDLLVRLFCEHALAAKLKRQCRPEFMTPILDALEAVDRATAERRFRHRRAPANARNRQEWVDAGA